MKKYLFILLSMLPYVSVAQYYNPFGSYQQQQQANQNAYNFGAGMGLYLRGISELCEERFSDAYNTFYEGAEYNPMNYEGLGVCSELGFGREVDHDDALNYYKLGANNGNNACRMHLQRIRQNGFWSKSYRQTFLKTLRAQMAASSSVPNYGGGFYNNSGGNSSSSTGGYTCPTCHGKGRCTVCAGRGYRISNGSYIECTMCNGGGACYGCHGSGTIR